MKDRIYELVKKIDDIISPYKKNIIIPLLKIIAIIIFCAIIARYLNGGETLADYANKMK